MNDFLKFVTARKAEAFDINLENENQHLADKLNERNQFLSNAERPEEIQKVSQVAEAAMDEIKAKILLVLRNENHLTKYENGLPFYLLQVRMWFEYKDLFERSKELEKPKKVRQPIKLPESNDFFIKENYSVPQRDEFIRNAKKDFKKDPKSLGEKIAELENPEGLGESQVLKFIPNSKSLTLTNFLKSIVGKPWDKNKNDQVLKSYREKKENLIDNAKQ